MIVHHSLAAYRGGGADMNKRCAVWLPSFLQPGIHFFGERTKVLAFNNFVLFDRVHLPIIGKRAAVVEEDLLSLLEAVPTNTGTRIAPSRPYRNCSRCRMKARYLWATRRLLSPCSDSIQCSIRCVRTRASRNWRTRSRESNEVRLAAKGVCPPWRALPKTRRLACAEKTIKLNHAVIQNELRSTTYQISPYPNLGRAVARSDDPLPQPQKTLAAFPSSDCCLGHPKVKLFALECSPNVPHATTIARFTRIPAGYFCDGLNSYMRHL